MELRRQDLRGAVMAAVVDEDQLVRLAHGVHRRIKAIEQRLQAILLVVDGDDDRDLDGA
ncbi:hypothetical protein D3C86_1911400 [compost metagenome]